MAGNQSVLPGAAGGWGGDGDLLANGVYIYKVVAKVNGKDMKLRDEGITDLFKNGFGKMYLMR